MSYKGYFNKHNGEEATKSLQQSGMDCSFSPVGGWSTLGWFSDPVLSNMLRRSEGRLAELIIHELTHGTCYLPDSVDYNENLATFIGEQGAQAYLKGKYGAQSAELKQYRDYLEDENLYGEYLLRAQQGLDSLYNSFDADLSITEKARRKVYYIRSIVCGIDSLPLHRPAVYRIDLTKEQLPNNTWFMDVSRYRRHQQEFEQEFKLHRGDLRAWIKMKKG